MDAPYRPKRYQPVRGSTRRAMRSKYAIGIADFDAVALSNLQRQIAHRTADIGRSKTDSAADAIAAINPHIRTVLHPVRLTAANAMAIISGYDIVADGSDNFATRFLINDACYLASKTLV